MPQVESDPELCAGRTTAWLGFSLILGGLMGWGTGILGAGGSVRRTGVWRVG